MQQQGSSLEAEHEAAQKAGLRAKLLNSVQVFLLSRNYHCIIRSSTISPVKYLAALADYIIAHGGKIYTQTHVNEFKNNGVIAIGFTR